MDDCCVNVYRACEYDCKASNNTGKRDENDKFPQPKNAPYGYFEAVFKDKILPVHIHKDILPEGSEIIPHWHNHLEFLYIVRGNPIITAGASCFTACEGMIISFASGEIHHILPGESGSEYYCIQITDEFARDNSFPTDSGSIVLCCFSEYSKRAFEEMKREYFADSAYRIAAVRALGVQFMLGIYRSDSASLPVNTIKRMPATVEITKCAMKHIKEHYFEQISTEDVAKAAGVSIYHLCRCFKEVTGMTVIRYINYIRCCAARAMLMKGERTVSETARECGFSGLSYFTKTYASFIGCTPMQTLKNGE